MIFILLVIGFVYRQRTARFVRVAMQGIGTVLKQPGGQYHKASHLHARTWGLGLMFGGLLVGWLVYPLYHMWVDIYITGTVGGGEPFSWFDGVSIWPSVLLRVFTGLLALYLLLRGMRFLHKNDKKLSGSFFGGEGGRDSSKAAGIWHDAVQPYAFTLPQFGRLVAYVLFLSVTGVVIFSMGEWPNLPSRGAVAAAVHWQTFFFAVISFLFLLAFVIDSTVRTCCLAKRLGDRERTQWSPYTVRKWFPEAMPAQSETSHYQDDWLDIQLIAARTTVVGGFIYYPFLILSLLIFARSPLIDNWQIPIGLMGVFGFYLVLALTCALFLRTAAERARRHALEHLTQGTIKALGDPQRKQEVEQMKLMKEAILAERRGAFSSFLHQPWLKAALLPLGSYSGIQLMESLSSMNL